MKFLVVIIFIISGNVEARHAVCKLRTCAMVRYLIRLSDVGEGFRMLVTVDSGDRWFCHKHPSPMTSMWPIEHYSASFPKTTNLVSSNSQYRSCNSTKMQITIECKRLLFSVSIQLWEKYWIIILIFKEILDFFISRVFQIS